MLLSIHPSQKSHDYEYALKDDKVILKIEPEEGYKIVGAFNGMNKEEALLMDSDGNYYIIVPNGGGVYLSVEFDLKSYNVIFQDDDETTVLQEGTVKHGETPAYNGETPTKPETAQYTYTFTGWDPEIDTVTGDITYKAVYTQTLRSYEISYILDGGTLDGQSGTVHLRLRHRNQPAGAYARWL